MTESANVYTLTPSLPEPPYPADTRVRGWQFRIDHERLNASDTWALSPPNMRPWLLMMWHVSWMQWPAGSFTNDDGIIAAKIGMDRETFDANRDLLMRGWELCADGRLYHRTVVEQVLEYLAAASAAKGRARASRAAAIARDENDPVSEENDDVARTRTNVHARARTFANVRARSAPVPVPVPVPKSPLGDRERETSAREENENQTALRASLSGPPGGWVDFCRETRPDVDPDKLWTVFRNYHGERLDTEHPDGMFATWKNWVIRERTTPPAPNGRRRPMDAADPVAMLRRLEAKLRPDLAGECWHE